MDSAKRQAARGTTTVAVTAAFVVLRHEVNGAEKVMTVLTDLFDLELRPRRAWRLPRYGEAVRAVTERALSREPVVAIVPAMGTVKIVPVCERLVLGSTEEFDALAKAIR